MKYAVTAATGHFGQIAVQHLNQLVGAANVVVVARNQEKAQKLFADNEIRQGDYGDAQSMIAALTGVDRVLFISSQPGGEVSRDQQHRNVVEALKANQVQLVAYTSFPHADQAKSALAADHRMTEELITATGLKHAFLRDNWYLENEASLVQAINAGQPAAYWTGKPMGWAREAEYAEAAAKVLVMDQPKPVYEFAGPIQSYAEFAAKVAAGLGKPNTAQQVSREEYIAALEKAGLSHDLAALYASFQDPAEAGDLSQPSDDLVEVLGRPLQPMEAAARELAD